MDKETLDLQIEAGIVKYIATTKINEYYVSKMGVAFSVNRKTNAVKEVGSKNPKGYCKLSINGKQYYIHRLVAELFIKNEYPEIYIHVHHKNSIRYDNRASNLMWVSERLHIDLHAEERAFNREYEYDFNYSDELEKKFYSHR